MAFAQEAASQEHFDGVNRANRDANIAAMTLSFVYLPGVNIPVGEQYKGALPEMVTIVASESHVKQILSDLRICQDELN